MLLTLYKRKLKLLGINVDINLTYINEYIIYLYLSSLSGITDETLLAMIPSPYLFKDMTIDKLNELIENHYTSIQIFIDNSALLHKLFLELLDLINKLHYEDENQNKIFKSFIKDAKLKVSNFFAPLCVSLTNKSQPILLRETHNILVGIQLKSANSLSNLSSQTSANSSITEKVIISNPLLSLEEVGSSSGVNRETDGGYKKKKSKKIKKNAK
jgi:hypothetical protein